MRVIASCDHVNAAMLWDSARAAALGWVWEEVATALPHLAELADGDALAHLLGHAGGGKGGAAALSQVRSSAAERARARSVGRSNPNRSAPRPTRSSRARPPARATRPPARAQAASARAVLGALNLNGKKVFRELAQHALAAAADEAKASVAAEEASQAPRVRAAARGTATGAKTAAKRSLTETRAESARARGLTLHELLERCRRGLFANGEASLRRHLSEFVDHRLVELERARYALARLSAPALWPAPAVWLAPCTAENSCSHASLSFARAHKRRPPRAPHRARPRARLASDALLAPSLPCRVRLASHARARSGSERYAVCLPEPIIKELMSSVLNNL